jgi:protein MpaA
MIFNPLDFGESVEGNKIEAYKSDMTSEKYIYLMAGTHGDEVEGVFVLKKLFEWIKDEYNGDDLPIIVIPILNPDGYRDQTRVNSHAVDLNRNYPTGWSEKYKKEKYNPGPAPLSEPENVFLDKLFNKFKPGIVLSFHSWKPILNFNGDIEKVASFLASYNEYEISDHIGYDTPGSLGAYVPEKYDAGVLTFECPVLSDEVSLNSIWDENQKGLKELIGSTLLKEYIDEKE